VTDWKLNGLRTFSELSVSFGPLVALAAVYGKVALAGVYIAGVPRCDTESLGASVAYCFEGNVADMGESVSA
jgi:hypothetical protein